jgi:hypothetical protein
MPRNELVFELPPRELHEKAVLAAVRAGVTNVSAIGQLTGFSTARIRSVLRWLQDIGALTEDDLARSPRPICDAEHGFWEQFVRIVTGADPSPNIGSRLRNLRGV